MKEFKARAVIHYGHAPDRVYKDLAEAWAAIVYDRIKDLSSADLRIIHGDLKKQIDILAGKVSVA